MNLGVLRVHTGGQCHPVLSAFFPGGAQRGDSHCAGQVGEGAQFLTVVG